MTKVYFETADCSINQADSEQMAGLLEEAQFKITLNQEESDVIIINTCTEKDPGESAFYKKLKELKEGYKIVILTGCLSQSNPKKFKSYPIIGTNQIHKVVEVVEEALNDNIVRELDINEKPPLNLPIVRTNPIIEIIPISRGCLDFCTFCKTKSAHKKMYSYSIKEIVDRAQKAVNEGVKEIWLTSQDTGCYGFDIDTDLPALLENLVNINGKFKVRVGMMNPDHMPKIQDRLIEIYKNKKVFKFLHLPVQAGDNEVLKKMKKLYTIEQYKQQIEAFKKAMPEINIMTDITVGFPGETEQQYWNTLNLVRETNPDSINISKFWPRPNTPAAKMKNKISEDQIKHRSKVLTDIFHNIAKMQNERWLYWEGPIIIDVKGKQPNQWIGRNESYKQIIVEGNYHLGQIVKIKVKKVDKFAILAEEIEKKQENKIFLQVVP